MDLSISHIEVIPLRIGKPKSSELLQDVDSGESEKLSPLWVKLHLTHLGIIWDEELQQTTQCQRVVEDRTSKQCKSCTFKRRKGTAFSIGKDNYDETRNVQKIKMKINYIHDRIAEINGGQLKQTILPMMIIPSQDPSDINGIPCIVRVFSDFLDSDEIRIYPSKNNLSATTAVPEGRILILSHVVAHAFDNVHHLCCIDMKPEDNLQNVLSQPFQCSTSSSNYTSTDNLILSSFDPEIVRSLALRMKKLMSKPILVGTSNDVTRFHQYNCKHQQSYHGMIDKYWAREDSSDMNRRENKKSAKQQRNVLLDGALTVFDSSHNSGKTALVTAIARSLLHCESVNVLSGAHLFSKYGANTDDALQSLLYHIVITAVMKSSRTRVASVCIILDQLDTFVPSYSSGRRKSDSSLPALIANEAYLSDLVHSLKTKKCFPSPRNIFFDNDSANRAYQGPVKVCLIGILSDTAPGITKMTANDMRLLTVLGQNRYRLKTTSVPNECKVNTPSNTKNNPFRNVGGNHKAKRALEDALAFDEAKRNTLNKFGLSQPTGVLLYGPPGNGKSLLAKAISQEINGLFLSVKATDLISSQVGESEKSLTSIFDLARQNSPSIIFIDEFQALFTSRDGHNGSSTGGSSRLASTLLSLMDDVTKWKNVSIQLSKSKVAETVPAEKERKIVVLAATNTPWMVDRAFLRPGRFDRVIHVDLPSCPERESILNIHVKNMKIYPNISVDGMCASLAKKCENFSGADLANLARMASTRCIVSGESYVHIRHFLEAIKYDFSSGGSSDTSLLRKLSKFKAK